MFEESITCCLPLDKNTQLVLSGFYSRILLPETEDPSRSGEENTQQLYKQSLADTVAVETFRAETKLCGRGGCAFLAGE